MRRTADELRHIAEMAFKRGMNNEQIAAETNLKPRKVQELIEEAGRWLLQVEHEYNEVVDQEIDRPLANELRDRLGLMDAVIPRKVPFDDSTLLASTLYLCRIAARYFSKLMDDAERDDIDIFALISGGDESFYTISSLDERKRPKAHFLAAAIIARGLIHHSIHIGPEVTTTYAWIRSGQLPGHLYYATASPPDVPERRGFESDRQQKKLKHDENRADLIRHTQQLFASNQSIKAALKQMQHGNTFIGGFGLVTPEHSHNRLTMAGLLQHYGVDPTLLPGAAGDFAYCLFDQNGNGRDDWEFFLTAGYPHSIRFLKEMVIDKGKVIGIGGFDRLPSIRAALKGRLFNILITDPQTAKALLDEYK